MADEQPKPKREKSEEDESDGEEMEIDEDEDAPPQHKPLGMPPCISPYERCSHDFIVLHKATIPPPTPHPSARLFCTNLPLEVTDDVLSVLFQQCVSYPLFHTSLSRMLWIGTKVSNQHMSCHHQLQMLLVQA